MVSCLAIPYRNHEGKLSSIVPARPPNGCDWQWAGSALLLSWPGASSSTPRPPEPAPLCCPIKVWGPVPQVLQPVRGHISFPAPTPACISPVPPPPGPVLLCCPCKVQSLPSHFYDSRPALPTSTGSKGRGKVGEGVTPMPSPPHGRQVVGPVLHSASGVSSPMPSPPGRVPLGCSGKAQGPLVQGLLQARGGGISPQCCIQ